MKIVNISFFVILLSSLKGTSFDTDYTENLKTVTLIQLILCLGQMRIPRKFNITYKEKTHFFSVFPRIRSVGS